jgi:hypothetical protein
MAGFPTRPNRDSFGPTFENERPVANPRREAGADLFNLMAWQSSGMGLTVPRAVLTAGVSGTTITTDYQGIAFDPNGDLSLISWTYAAVGRYTFAFAQNYNDENGISRTLELVAGIAHPINQTGFAVGVVNLTSLYEGEVRFFDAAGAAVDVSGFIIQLW